MWHSQVKEIPGAPLFRIDLSVCKKLVHEALRSRQEALLCFGLKLCLASSIRSFKANNRRRAPVVVCGALLGRGPASIKIDYLGLGNFLVLMSQQHVLATKKSHSKSWSALNSLPF
ncbi:hypothetical protein CDAR_268741 [Caerostris darwini]|uniref:Uncharacterized protein n=1 Tax=Caerostris darwini TaxID=1538125 RepID=A0AAV4R024_9ARAC|nr:hypothetical protein CDAR_268741 [Caerostris darwini]